MEALVYVAESFASGKSRSGRSRLALAQSGEVCDCPAGLHVGAPVSAASGAPSIYEIFGQDMRSSRPHPDVPGRGPGETKICDRIEADECRSPSNRTEKRRPPRCSSISTSRFWSRERRGLLEAKSLKIFCGAALPTCVVLCGLPAIPKSWRR